LRCASDATILGTLAHFKLSTCFFLVSKEQIMEVVDLTQTIHDEMQIYAGDPAPAIRRFLTHDKDYCHVDMIRLGSHTGTHVDAPYHFLKDGMKISEIPVQRFIGSGVLLDVSGKSDREPIEPGDIEPYRSDIEKGDFAVFMTGWDRYLGTPRYLQHPCLSAGGAGLLLELGVVLVGIDALNIDFTSPDVNSSDGPAQDAGDEDQDYPAHDILLGNNILIVENLCNLDKIKQVRGLYSFLPLKLKDSDGSPIRAVFIDGTNE
jgi:kynurenine formamidase